MNTVAAIEAEFEKVKAVFDGIVHDESQAALTGARNLLNGIRESALKLAGSVQIDAGDARERIEGLLVEAKEQAEGTIAVARTAAEAVKQAAREHCDKLVADADALVAEAKASLAQITTATETAQAHLNDVITALNLAEAHAAKKAVEIPPNG